jgi:hypothetical protein
MEVKNILKGIGMLILAASLPFSASAQFDEGDNVLGVGVGLLGGYGIGFSGSSVSQSPAITLHYDHGMGDLGPGTWGLGGFLGYKTVTYDERYLNYYNYDWKYTFFVVGARGTWHYNEWHGNDKLDTYGIVMLAYKSISWKDRTDYGPYGNLASYSYSGSGIDVGLGVGARYWFSEKFGGFAEIGYGIATLQLGLAAKL